MAESAQATLAAMKSAMSSNNPVFATLKIQYTGSWQEDITTLSNLCGCPVETLLKLNPWLKTNTYAANNHDYVVVQVGGPASSSSGGNVSSNNQNDTAAGYYATDNWVFPLGVGSWYVTQGYHSGHTGLDLTTGTPGAIDGNDIYSSKAGEVVQAYLSDSWGWNVLIKHTETTDESGNCYYTRYAHMRGKSPMQVGDKVSQGDLVGYVGNTGKSTGAHLHYSIYYTSATRTDYTNFTGSADFAVDPNDIPDFPGKPFVTNQYSKVNYVKSTMISPENVQIIIDATKGDGSVTQEQIDTVIDETTNNILAEKNVEKESDIGKLIRDFVDAQINGIIESGEQAAIDLISGGSFESVFENFCNSVVDNAKWYVQNKIDGVIQEAIDYGREKVEDKIQQGKDGLKSWIWNVTDTDPDSQLASDVGAVLDHYVDNVIGMGWGAVETAISTGDIRSAATTFLDNLKDYSIDYVVDLGTSAACNAITSYIGTRFQSDLLGQVAADLGVGIVNTIGWAIGAVLKGDISFKEAAKNVAIQVTSMVVSQVLTNYLAPVVTNWVAVGVSWAAAQVGISIGVGTIAGVIAGPIGALAGFGVSWVMRKLWG